jgi:hypothetical protein
MNVLRHLARNLWNAIETRGAERQAEVGAKTLHAARQQRVAPVLGLSRFRDGFEQLPPADAARTFASGRAPTQTFAARLRDGFDAVARRPVDLSGGSRPAAASASREANVAAHPGFAASLQDLAALI